MLKKYLFAIFSNEDKLSGISFPISLNLENEGGLLKLEKQLSSKLGQVNSLKFFAIRTGGNLLVQLVKRAKTMAIK